MEVQFPSCQGVRIGPYNLCIVGLSHISVQMSQECVVPRLRVFCLYPPRTGHVDRQVVNHSLFRCTGLIFENVVVGRTP